MIAQVTGLDISIFLVINISFSESWQESSNRVSVGQPWNLESAS
jgi:hypothetical protein